MNCSIASTYPDQLQQGLDNSHQQRLHSLELQMLSLEHYEPHIEMLKDILNEHNECKIIRGKVLLEQQYRLVNRQEKENQLRRYHIRIKQLQQSIKIKEEDMWEQSMNGKRIKNIALHRQALNLFHHQEQKSSNIFAQLIKMNQLKRQIAKLTSLANKQEGPQKEPEYYMRGLDTMLLKMIRDEEQIKIDLEELQQSLQDQLQEQKTKQRQFIDKYRELSCQDARKQSKSKEESGVKDASSKTISTQGDQDQL